jgi:hypothetical protein
MPRIVVTPHQWRNPAGSFARKRERERDMVKLLAMRIAVFSQRMRGTSSGIQRAFVRPLRTM